MFYVAVGGGGWRGLCCSGWFGPESDMEFTVKPKQEVGRGGGWSGDRGRRRIIIIAP
jgi:hypothetical protein